MSLRKSVIAASAALSMIVIPTIAQAAPTAAVSKLSIRGANAVRQGVRVKKASKQDGGIGTIVIAVLAAAAVVGGIVVAADGSSAPASP